MSQSHQSQSVVPNEITKTGQFDRKASLFRSSIPKHGEDPSNPYQPEENRYTLYVHYVCPWAHRTNIVRSLKGLEDIIDLVVLDGWSQEKGWEFTGKMYGEDKDKYYGFKYLRQLYEWGFQNQNGEGAKYEGKVTVPVLWDRKTKTIVNNESSEIIRQFYTSFDHLLPSQLQESTLGYYPHQLRTEIDEMNEWVYDTINNGVYKCGFATTQEAYESNLYPLFKSLDRLEDHLKRIEESPEGEKGPYLWGPTLTETDIRLYPTLIRFDVAYYPLFKTNLKMIRWDYPRVHKWLRWMYWKAGDGAFGEKTTKFDIIKLGYTATVRQTVVPAGPDPSIMPL